MKTTIHNIKTNGLQEFENVVGNIKKIFILSESRSNKIILTFRTNENEVIYQVTPDNEIVNLYPYNFIDKQGRGCEYFSQGSLYLDVEGLEEGQEIKQVSVFYQ